MKCIIKNCLKSINESNFTFKEISFIWDFYVTKSLSAKTSQKRKVKDYNYKELPYEEMIKIANISDENIIYSPNTNLNKNLTTIDLKTKISNKYIEIDIDTCRAAFLLKEREGKAKSILYHIRNALAHGNTYLFDNGNMLLQDKDGQTITAMILFRQQTLLDWISLIDKDQKFYKLHNVNNIST